MGLPGHHRTSSHKRRRASHFALTKLNLIPCANCKIKIPYNMVCKFCGFLKDIKKIDVKQFKKEKTSTKTKTK